MNGNDTKLLLHAQSYKPSTATEFIRYYTVLVKPNITAKLKYFWHNVNSKGSKNSEGTHPPSLTPNNINMVTYVTRKWDNNAKNISMIRSEQVYCECDSKSSITFLRCEIWTIMLTCVYLILASYKYQLFYTKKNGFHNTTLQIAKQCSGDLQYPFWVTNNVLSVWGKYDSGLE